MWKYRKFGWSYIQISMAISMSEIIYIIYLYLIIYLSKELLDLCRICIK